MIFHVIVMTLVVIWLICIGVAWCSVYGRSSVLTRAPTCHCGRRTEWVDRLRFHGWACGLHGRDWWKQ